MAAAYCANGARSLCPSRRSTTQRGLDLSDPGRLFCVGVLSQFLEALTPRFGQCNDRQYQARGSHYSGDDHRSRQPDGGVKKVGEQEGAGEGAQLACAGRNAVTGGADIGGEQLGRVDERRRVGPNSVKK